MFWEEGHKTVGQLQFLLTDGNTDGGCNESLGARELRVFVFWTEGHRIKLADNFATTHDDDTVNLGLRHSE